MSLLQMLTVENTFYVSMILIKIYKCMKNLYLKTNCFFLLYYIYLHLYNIILIFNKRSYLNIEPYAYIFYLNKILKVFII